MGEINGILNRVALENTSSIITTICEDIFGNPTQTELQMREEHYSPSSVIQQFQLSNQLLSQFEQQSSLEEEEESDGSNSTRDCSYYFGKFAFQFWRGKAWDLAHQMVNYCNTQNDTAMVDWCDGGCAYFSERDPSQCYQCGGWCFWKPIQGSKCNCTASKVIIYNLSIHPMELSICFLFFFILFSLISPNWWYSSTLPSILYSLYSVFLIYYRSNRSTTLRGFLIPYWTGCQIVKLVEEMEKAHSHLFVSSYSIIIWYCPSLFSSLPPVP